MPFPSFFSKFEFLCGKSILRRAGTAEAKYIVHLVGFLGAFELSLNFSFDVRRIFGFVSKCWPCI